VTRPLRFDPAALDELVSARDWYNGRHPGVGDEFVGEFWRVVERLRDWPASAPQQRVRSPEREVRRALFKRFPYSVIYEVRADTLVILADVHGKRRPGYWRDRL
jgi:toxin ParE1/3/4